MGETPQRLVSGLRPRLDREAASRAQSPDHLHAPFAVWLDPGMPPKEKREIVLESLKVDCQVREDEGDVWRL